MSVVGKWMFILALIGVGGSFLPTDLPGQQPPAPRVVFAALGDAPYEGKEFPMIRSQLKELPARVQFVVHLGDIKRGLLPCLDHYYAHMAKTMKVSAKPVFFVPGDNEWNDCLRPAHGWKLWQKYFLRFEENWPTRFDVHRQKERNENFRFMHREVLFVGVNLVGGRVHDADEWERRIEDNSQFTRHSLEESAAKTRCAVILAHAFPDGPRKEYAVALVKAAQKYDKPILYLHGDGHKWIKDRPFAEVGNILRVQVDRGAVRPPVRVTVRPKSEEVFRFERQ